MHNLYHLGAPERRGHQDGQRDARTLQRGLHARHLYPRHDARADRGGEHDGERAGGESVIASKNNPHRNRKSEKETKPNLRVKRTKSPGRTRPSVLFCPLADFPVWVRIWVKP